MIRIIIKKDLDGIKDLERKKCGEVRENKVKKSGRWEVGRWFDLDKYWTIAIPCLGMFARQLDFGVACGEGGPDS